MSRVLKFRIVYQHEETGRIAVRSCGLGEAFPFLGDRWAIIGKDQFTGLLDKTGNEIYEGDICRLFYSDGSSEEQPAQIKYGLHKVGFDSDCATTGPALGFYFSPYPALYGKMGIGEHFNWEHSPYLEVIGNVYENPELVEQGKEEAWDE